MVLLQITTGSTEVQPAVEQSLSVLELAVKGGWMMIPIALSSIVAIYIFVERMLTINRANQSPDAFMGKIKELVGRGDSSSLSSSPLWLATKSFLLLPACCLL